MQPPSAASKQLLPWLVAVEAWRMVLDDLIKRGPLTLTLNFLNNEN
ncbi:MAG: hypothetical protein ACLPPF_01440 [Rhodomicrobium sp.]